MENNSLKIAIVNGGGDILCLVDGKFTFLPLPEVTFENIFVYWSRDLGDLYNLYDWRKNPDQILTEMDLDSCSILDICIDAEEGIFWFE